MHLNTHDCTTNVECRNEQENGYYNHIDNPVDGAQSPDTEITGLPPNNEVNDPGRA
jgi:hypothetical protein